MKKESYKKWWGVGWRGGRERDARETITHTHTHLRQCIKIEKHSSSIQKKKMLPNWSIILYIYKNAVKTNEYVS